jgi:ATP/maltotriose-dependent transcriptional regulator MalT
VGAITLNRNSNLFVFEHLFSEFLNYIAAVVLPDDTRIHASG